MAVWIKAKYDDPIVIQPKNEKAFTVAELQEFVGGYIEALRLRNGLIMWLNEEGKLKGLPVNQVATWIAHAHTKIALNDPIVGDVLLASADESGEGTESE